MFTTPRRQKTSPRDPFGLPKEKGTYVLWLRLPEAGRIVVGRLGASDLSPGWYGYVGSARGPGGLAARVGRHLKGNGARRWHIDFLRREAVPQAVWCAVSVRQLEHPWAAALAAMTGATLPLPGFGASDCRCPAHLVRFSRLPAVQRFVRTMKDFGNSGLPPLVVLAAAVDGAREWRKT